MRNQKQITKHARQLRQESSFEEEAFWYQVRNRKFNGLKFNRHPDSYRDDSVFNKTTTSILHCRFLLS